MDVLDSVRSNKIQHWAGWRQFTRGKGRFQQDPSIRWFTLHLPVVLGEL
jgi:hypothetical protein